MESILRWAGSKRLLMSDLLPKVPLFERYVEPFAGSACLFFMLEPERALLSDLNSDLMNAYRAIRRDVDLVLDAFRRFKTGRAAYYRIRSMRPETLTPAEAAARFLYLNRFCFNGIYRTNKRGVFNVPYGPPKKPLTLFEDRLRNAAELLKTAELHCGDFSDVRMRISKGDFVYLDPPYVVNQRRVFSQYLPGTFSRDDLSRLRSLLAEIDEKGATFVVSYEASEEASAIAGAWNSISVSVRRNVAGFAGARRHATELLISNGDFR